LCGEGLGVVSLLMDIMDGERTLRTWLITPQRTPEAAGETVSTAEEKLAALLRSSGLKVPVGKTSSAMAGVVIV
jgi:hypothetical protein